MERYSISKCKYCNNDLSMSHDKSWCLTKGCKNHYCNILTINEVCENELIIITDYPLYFDNEYKYGNIQKVYAVGDADNPYGGFCIDKIFRTKEDAENYIKEQDNIMLAIEEYEI